MCGVIAKPQLVMTDSSSNEIISLSASHHTFGRDVHQYHKSECTAGMMTSPKKGSYCYPHEKVKQWYFLVLSLRTVITSQPFLCLLPTLPLNSAPVSSESMVLMQCYIKLSGSGTALNKVLRRI